MSVDNMHLLSVFQEFNFFYLVTTAAEVETIINFSAKMVNHVIQVTQQMTG